MAQMTAYYIHTLLPRLVLQGDQIVTKNIVFQINLDKILFFQILHLVGNSSGIQILRKWLIDLYLWDIKANYFPTYYITHELGGGGGITFF